MVAFVEKARRELYTFPANSERGWPVGGVVTNHTVLGFPLFLPWAGRVSLLSQPSEVKELVTKRVRKIGLPKVRCFFFLASFIKAESKEKKEVRRLSP